MNGWKDWQIENRWEMLNTPDPAEDQMKEAAKEIEEGLTLIDNGLDWINSAVKSLKDTPMENKVESLMQDMEELAIKLSGLKDKYEMGCRD